MNKRRERPIKVIEERIDMLSSAMCQPNVRSDKKRRMREIYLSYLNEYYKRTGRVYGTK